MCQVFYSLLKSDGGHPRRLPYSHMLTLKELLLVRKHWWNNSKGFRAFPSGNKMRNRENKSAVEHLSESNPKRCFVDEDQLLSNQSGGKSRLVCSGAVFLPWHFSWGGFSGSVGGFFLTIFLIEARRADGIRGTLFLKLVFPGMLRTLMLMSAASTWHLTCDRSDCLAKGIPPNNSLISHQTHLVCRTELDDHLENFHN